MFLFKCDFESRSGLFLLLIQVCVCACVRVCACSFQLFFLLHIFIMVYILFHNQFHMPSVSLAVSASELQSESDQGRRRVFESGPAEEIIECRRHERGESTRG